MPSSRSVMKTLNRTGSCTKFCRLHALHFSPLIGNRSNSSNPVCIFYLIVSCGAYFPVRQKGTSTLSYPQESFLSFRGEITSARRDYFFSVSSRQIPSGCFNSRSLQGRMTCSSIFLIFEIKLNNLEKLRQAFCKRKDKTMNSCTRHVLWSHSFIPIKTHRNNCAIGAFQLFQRRDTCIFGNGLLLS